MAWKFWKKEPSAEITKLQQQSEQLQEHISSLEEQLQKATRLQYKTGKNMEGKLDPFTEEMERKEQESAPPYAEITQRLIRQIDDMDMINAQLTDDSLWRDLIKTWTGSLLQILTDLDVNESIQSGEMFDPKRAEAIDAVPPSEPEEVPYQIVQILKRGYTDANETLIRKAQVITVKENSQ